VKVLRPDLAAALGPERFLQDIEIAAQLQHPNILALYDSGEIDLFLFYVMPFVEGESLRERLHREKQLSVDESLALTKSVASALDYAHRHNVIHRDIKPENILIHDGQPVVADFGIALALKAAGGARLTETGLSLGTPQYMSPEQATGDREVDRRSDIYSLACVLYEMLAGDPPHTGSTVQAIIAKVVTDRARPVREIRDTVPRDGSSTQDRMSGDVIAGNGNTVGTCLLEWASEYIRQAELEIDCMKGCEPPLTSTRGEDWASVYKKIQWKMDVSDDQRSISADAFGSGIRGDEARRRALQELLDKWRGHSSPDLSWCYHLFCFDTLKGNRLGWMYDRYATDASVPREGAAVASNWTPSQWTGVGERFDGFTKLQDQKDAYFRTAVHEVGHMQGIRHCNGDPKHRFMKETRAIAEAEKKGWQKDIVWEFHPEHQKGLQHWPDLCVRPSGKVPFSRSLSSGDAAEASDLGVCLDIKPVQERVPLGAPVRLEL